MLGGIIIADNIKIGANAVVTKSFDEKVAVMDTVDIHFGEEWMANVKGV